jgi:hypothetical protein
MRVYTVRKSGPNTDREFQTYIDLLQTIGIDVADAPRTPEPGTTNRWLYIWKDKVQAERFARVLGDRLRDPSWRVHEFDVPEDPPFEERRGPLAPLTIFSIPTSAGTEFRLESASQERIMAHFPNARVVGQVTFPPQAREDWDHVARLLTGIPDEGVEQLGGMRIVTTEGAILYERLSSGAGS